MDIQESFWTSNEEEMKQGYKKVDGIYQCLLCGYKSEEGVIYQEGERFVDARKHMQLHIVESHISVFHFLNGLDKKLSGLSEHQSKLLELFYEGKSDQEIQEIMGIGSSSTIRNHRFTLREKEKQARVTYTLMSLLREQSKGEQIAVLPHKTATMVDDRYQVSESEFEKLVEKYFPQGVQGPLKTFAIQEKHKIVVLRIIANKLQVGKVYTEKELDRILKDIYPQDHVILRRYLIQYGFVVREKDGSAYWLKEVKEEKGIRSGVYSITNRVNGKVFLGTARNIDKLNGQVFQLNMGSFRNKKLQEEWTQYGEDHFQIEVKESFVEKGEVKEVNAQLKRLLQKWMEQILPYDEKGYH